MYIVPSGFYMGFGPHACVIEVIYFELSSQYLSLGFMENKAHKGLEFMSEVLPSNYC